MTCRRCGEILNANARFCWSCGAPQNSTNGSETLAVPVVSVSEPPHYELVRNLQGPHGDLLIVIAGTKSGDQFTLIHEETTVGRDESCHILLDDVSVSRHHGVFTRTASGRISLRDLNSLNGTYVNGRRVEEVILKSGDEVQIGKFKLVFWEATP